MLHDVPTNPRSLILQSCEAFLMTRKMVLLYVVRTHSINTFQRLFLSRLQPASIWPTPILPMLILLPPQPTPTLLLLRAPVVMRLHSYQARVRFLRAFHHASSHFNPPLINPQIPSNTRANMSYLFMRPLMFKFLQRRCVSLQLFCNDYA